MSGQIANEQLLNELRELRRRLTQEKRLEGWDRLIAAFEELLMLGAVPAVNPDIVTVHDHEGNLLFIKSFNDLDKRLGFKAAEVLGKTINSIVPPRFAQERLSRIQDVFIYRKSFNYETLMQLPNTELWIHIDLNPMLGNKGQVLAVVSFIRDITDIKDEEQLQSIERDLDPVLGTNINLETAVKSVLRTIVGIKGIDAGGIYVVDRSSNELRLIGNKSMSQWFLETISLYSVERPEALAALTQEKAFISNWEGIAKPEGVRLDEVQSLAVIPVVYENITVAVMSVASLMFSEIPLSSRKALERTAECLAKSLGPMRARKALAETRLKPREPSIPVGKRFSSGSSGRQNQADSREVFWIRSRGKFIHVSENYEQVWGRSRESLYNDLSSFMESIHPDDRERALPTYLAEDGGEKFCGEHRVLHPDGSVRWLRARSFPVVKDGKITRFAGVAEDITESKLADEALRGLHKELGERDSHLAEMNTTIRVLLKKQDEGKEELRAAILDNVKHLVLPYLEKLRHTKLDKEQSMLIEILMSNLDKTTSLFVHKLSDSFLRLTPTEIRVAELIRDGNSTKEVAEILNLSPTTIRSHRESVRKKLDLRGKDLNLRAYLQSLE